MSKSNRAESSCGRKADNTLLQLPNDVIGIAKNRLSSISSKFRAPAEIPQKAPDNLKQRSRVSTLSYFRKPKSKSKSEGPESPNINGEYRETTNNSSKPKFKRQISIDIAPSRPVSMISSSHRRNSIEQVESPNSFPGTSTQRFGFFNHHHDTSSKAHVEDGRKPAIESICLFPRLVFPVHSSAITNSSMSANLNSDSLERPRKKLSFREPEIVETKQSPAVSLRKAKLDMFAALSDVSEDKSDGVASIQSLPVSGDDELESQAMRIVRTVGQAFEVCHKLSPDAHAEAASSSAACDISEQAALSISDKISEISDRPPLKKEAAVPPKSYDKGHGELDEGHQMHLLTLEPPPKAAHANRLQRPTHLDVDVSLATNRINQQAQAQVQAQTQVLSREPTPGYTDRSIMTTPQATEHREKFLEQSLEQQRQQTRAATAQLAMLNDQLVVEKAARVEAQARTHQLLLHNKELIDHISMLVAHLQERERGGAGSLPYSLSGHQLTNLPQAQSLRDVLEKQNQAEVRAPRLLHSPANLVLDNRGLLDSMSSLLVPRSPHSPRDPAYENNNNSSLASAATDSPGGFPGPYNFTYSLHQPEPIPSPMARRYNNMTTLTSAAAYLDQQNANDLTDFLIDLVNQQSPNGPHLPQNQHIQQQSVNSQLQQQQAVNSQLQQQVVNSQLQQQAVNSQLQQQAVNSQLQQQALNRLNLYSGQSSPLQHRHPIGASSDHLFASANQQSPNMPRQLSSDMRHSHSFLNTSAIQQEPLMSPREEDECQFIRPLSQIGTITTLDEEGRVRIVVPTKKSPQPIITRTTSERVPNKNSVLMAQVRDQWGRHTTK